MHHASTYPALRKCDAMAFLCRLLARLLHDHKGNVLAIVGAGLVPLTIMIGSGVDLSRAYMAKSKMQSACDAASLAARRVMKNDSLNDTVRDTGQEFFTFNFPQGQYGAQAFTPVITKPEAGVIRVNASTAIPTAIMRLFGFETLPVAVSCDASLNFVNTDIVLVLDVTASMAQTVDGTPKINALQDAVMALYDELAPIQTQLAAQGLRLRYGIVPYSSTVNVGRLIYGQNPSYMRSETTATSRKARFTKPVYVQDGKTTTMGWEVSPSLLTNNQCKAYVEASDVNGGGPAPKATTVTKYQGTSSNPGYVQSENRGWSGAPNGSSCRRWKIVETSTYKTEYEFDSWVYTNANYDVTDFVKPGGTMALAASTAGTVGKAGDYQFQELPILTGKSTNPISWNGCIEERDTVSSIDGGTNLTIPSGAHDLNINLIPNSEETRWRPMVPELIYPRSSGSTSSTSTTGPITGDGEAFFACPSEARRLAVWDRTALNTYITGLQTIGGTYHDIGMIWGARLSSTGGIFGDGCEVFNGMPCNRHIIFMTDGDQTAYCNVYSAYGVERNDMRIRGSSGCTSTSDTNSIVKNLVSRHEQRFRMACNAAKNMNTSVWVIGFDTALNSNLTGCASSPGQADTAANRTALIAKFREIGNQIGALRLTQ